MVDNEPHQDSGIDNRGLEAYGMHEIVRIGANDYGYWFGVGRMGERYIGFAIGELSNGDRMMFMLPGIAENHTLGITDRERAVKWTGAIAQDPTYGYGGISRWFVPEELRGKPDDFRCADCEEVGCAGDCSLEGIL